MCRGKDYEHDLKTTGSTQLDLYSSLYKKGSSELKRSVYNVHIQEMSVITYYSFKTERHTRYWVSVSVRFFDKKSACYYTYTYSRN